MLSYHLCTHAAVTRDLHVRGLRELERLVISLWIDPLPVEPEMNGGHLELYWTLVVPTVCPYNHQDVTVRRKPFAAILAFMGRGLG